MADSNAERQRRHRRHKAGDHTLCDPARCQREALTVTPDVTPDVASNAVESSNAPMLGARGRRLWREVTTDGDELAPTERVLLEEACRTADRLDKLDRLLTGEAHDWVRLVEQKSSGDVVEVVIDKALSEARQQAIALKQLVAELRQSRAVRAGKVGESGGAPERGAPQPVTGKAPAGKDAGGGHAGGVADLTARIAERRAQTAG